MRPDVENSRYREDPRAEREFDRHELRRARYLLRRLRFLETKIAQGGGMNAPDANGGGVHAELELEALEWALEEIGFLETTGDKR